MINNFVSDSIRKAYEDEKGLVTDGNGIFQAWRKYDQWNVVRIGGTFGSLELAKEALEGAYRTETQKNG